MCICKNIHSGHKIIDIADEESLKKENISIKDSNKDLDEKRIYWGLGIGDWGLGIGDWV